MTTPRDFICERILLTNDDGIDAPGLRVLEQVAAQLAPEIWVVAPRHDQSGTSHSISLHDPLRVSPQGEVQGAASGAASGMRRFAVPGTPGDCVVMGVRHLMAGRRPDMILSGVNRGGNLGVETVFSGTVGAAMTGMLLGIPSIALSQVFVAGQDVPWDTARTLAPAVIRQLAAMDWAAEACLNVNFPACPPSEARKMLLTSQGLGLMDGVDVVTGTDPRGLPYHWLTLTRARLADDAGSEAAGVAAFHVTATPLRFERTHDSTLAAMRAGL